MFHPAERADVARHSADRSAPSDMINDSYASFLPKRSRQAGRAITSVHINRFAVPSPMKLCITIPDKPSEADRAAVLAPLRAYNISRAGDPYIRPVAVLLTNKLGDHVGGLWGRCAYNWLFIELLAVPEEYRGQGYGLALMQQGEAIARADGCVGIWLDTYEFQARGFYEKLGFDLFGTLDDHPIGQKRFFLRKQL